MNKFILNLNSIKKIKEFSIEISKFESDIDVVSGRYIVNAKSIMALFSMDLSKPIEVLIHSDDELELNKFSEAMKKFEV